MTDARQERGLQIAKVARIDRSGENFLVPSMSGNGRYTANPAEATCTCPDCQNGHKCKHLFAVEYVLTQETTVNADGTTTVTDTVSIKATKKTTYPQNWPAYNLAQQNEKDEFQSLLADLCRGIQNRPQTGRGRRYLRLADAVFACTFKVYSTVSSRRFTSDLNEAKERGYIEDVAHFNSIFDYLQNPLLTDILKTLIVEAAKPLSAIESDFAVDSTGFTSCRFHRWYDHKYGTIQQEHDWVKAHFACGVKTNVVTAVEVLHKDTHDAPVLPALVAKTAENFQISELSADKAYGSLENYKAIDKVGATPFIQFKSNATGAVGGLFQKAFHFFCFKREEFLAHYHKRSNIESTVSMIKAKFGDHLRSKTDVAMKNEALCKILCHNICCLISAMYELGIDPQFLQPAAA